MALNKAVNNVDARGNKPAQKAKEGLKFPLGNAHWEKDVAPVDMADGRYASEMNTCEEYKQQADALAGYAKKHRMKY